MLKDIYTNKIYQMEYDGIDITQDIKNEVFDYAKTFEQQILDRYDTEMEYIQIIKDIGIKLIPDRVHYNILEVYDGCDGQLY